MQKSACIIDALLKYQQTSWGGVTFMFTRQNTSVDVKGAHSMICA